MDKVQSLLEVRNLTKIFALGGPFGQKNLVAVDDVSFSMPSEKPLILSIVGESGSGKTTIGRLILGFIEPTSGQVLYKGRNIWGMKGSEWKAYRQDVQAVLQDPYASFNPLHTVDRVLMAPIRKFRLVNSKTESSELVHRTLETVGLEAGKVLGKYPHQFSGGERQRIMLARAFLLKPTIIIADEPVSMIDTSLRAEVLDAMQTLKSHWSISFVYISHDLSTVYHISEKMIALFLGSIVELGSTNAIIENPLHPYVQLLVDSVPIPDPDNIWKEDVKLPRTEIVNRLGLLAGCKFYERCPRRMELCKKEFPKMIEVERDHMVACFRYEGDPKTSFNHTV